MPAFLPSDTIYALATPPGVGALALVRVSGPRVPDLLRQFCGMIPPPRVATLCRLRDPATQEILDQAVVTYFRAPASFTGEDVAEFSLHGGRAVVQGVLAAFGAVLGLRGAEPGEFTKRAFLQHKLDLTEAEAIADLIHAETALQRRQALAQLNGTLSELYDRWRDRLIKACAYIEAHLDFPDEDLPTDLVEQVRPSLTELSCELSHHLDDHGCGERLRDGARVVIVGAPNAGKSSLLNALAQRDVAIVSAYAGTTRDVIDVHLDLHGYPVIVTDTAGLRPDALQDAPADLIEAEGIRRAMVRARAADLKIVLFDAMALDSPDQHSLALLDDTAIAVINKIDLRSGGPLPLLGGQTPLGISVETGTGLKELLTALTDRLGALMGTGESTLLTRPRHRDALIETRAAIERAMAQRDIVLLAEELRQAIMALSRITGRVDVEDLLDIIFRDFCIGK